MDYLIKANEIFLESEVLKNASVLVKDGVIAAINPTSADGATVIELGGLRLVPAFVDIHIHGCNGHDTMDATYTALNEISKHKVKEGVGYFVPTTVTSFIPKIKHALSEIASAIEKGTDGAVLLGSFIEGPYLDAKFKGAHKEDLIVPINLEEIGELVEAGKGTVLSIAIAPNLPGAMEAIEFLRNKGVQSRLGHSGCTCATAQEAFRAGAHIDIHTYNAMSGLTHREPGLVGAVLTDDSVYAEIICDMIHVSREAIQVVYRCKSADKMLIVTDCMLAGGMSDGNYTLGELNVIVKDGVARTEGGALAGSTVGVIQSVKNLVEKVGIPVFDAVKMASATPAKAINRFNEIGSIEVGKKASFTAFGDDFDVKFVMIDGTIRMDRTNG